MWRCRPRARYLDHCFIEFLEIGGFGGLAPRVTKITKSDTKLTFFVILNDKVVRLLTNFSMD